MITIQRILYVHVDVYTLLCVKQCLKGCGVFRTGIVSTMFLLVDCLVGGMIFKRFIYEVVYPETLSKNTLEDDVLLLLFNDKRKVRMIAVVIGRCM